MGRASKRGGKRLSVKEETLRSWELSLEREYHNPRQVEPLNTNTLSVNPSTEGHSYSHLGGLPSPAPYRRTEVGPRSPRPSTHTGFSDVMRLMPIPSISSTQNYESSIHTLPRSRSRSTDSSMPEFVSSMNGAGSSGLGRRGRSEFSLSTLTAGSLLRRVETTVHF